MGDKAARNGSQQVAQAQQGVANTDITNNNADTTAVQQFADSLLPTTAPGGPTGTTAGLSPYSSAQYGSDLENINQTYGNLKQQGFNLLGSAGFGASPSGQRSSLVNTLLNNEAQADTNAYRTALGSTLQEGEQGVSELQGEQQINNPTTALTAASNDWKNRFQEGTTAGDIATGLTTAAGLAATGAGIAGGFGGIGLGGSPDAAAGLDIGPSAGSMAGSAMAPGGSIGPSTMAATAPVSASSTPGIGSPGAPAGISSLYAPMPAAPSVAPQSSTRPASGFARVGQQAQQ